MSLHKNDHPDAKAWAFFLDGFDPFIYLRLAEAAAHPAVRADFEESYPGHEYTEGHAAIAVHVFRMMAAEALFLLLLQAWSQKNILQFMSWCKNQRFRSAIEKLSDLELPEFWPQDRPMEIALAGALSCDQVLPDSDGVDVFPSPSELAKFISAEARDYLRTEAFNSIKHGGRFSIGFPTLSVEVKPGEWREMISAPHGVTAYNYKEESGKAAVSSSSLELDIENDLERLRGLTSLMDKAKAARILRLKHRAEANVWNYGLVEASFRHVMNWTQRFRL